MSKENVTYHISKNGNINECQAKDGNCPLGGLHFKDRDYAVHVTKIKEATKNITESKRMKSVFITNYHFTKKLFTKT